MLRLPSRPLGAGVAALLLVSCTAAQPAAPTAAPTTAPAAKPAATTPPAAKPAASPGSETLQLGDLNYRDHGTADTTGMTEFTISAQDNYFEPTFLRGTPGQTLKLTVRNTGSNPHTLTIPAQDVDMNVASGATITADVTFPSSGVVLYICKLHTRGGMNGQLLAGNATPQPVASPAASTAPTQPRVNAPARAEDDYGY